jgi:predicted Zn-dependent peptidase
VEALETVLDLEADRMRSLRISAPALEREREVVLEERRLHVENDVGGLLGEELDGLAYRLHPYRWPVIGRAADVRAVTKADCEHFFSTYYAPNNATLYLAGDFAPAHAERLIRRAFRDVPRGPPVPPVTLREPAQRGERRAELRQPAQAPQVLVAYAGPAAATDDALALDVAQFALSVGESSRLVQQLIFRQERVVNVSMDWTWRADPGLIAFSLELKPNGHPEEAERALEEQIARVVEEPLSAREVQKARNNLEAAWLSEVATAAGRAATAATYESHLGTWRAMARVRKRYASLTARQVREAAARYFRKENRTVVTLVPEPSA